MFVGKVSRLAFLPVSSEIVATVAHEDSYEGEEAYSVKPRRLLGLRARRSSGDDATAAKAKERRRGGRRSSCRIDALAVSKLATLSQARPALVSLGSSFVRVYSHLLQ